MKNLLIVFFLLLSITAFSQFRMVGTATWSTLNDSTYQGTVSFQSDLTGMGYLATHIVDTFRLFTPVEKIYRIDSVWNKTFSSATLRIVEMLGTQGVPVGQVMVFNPDGRNTIPQNPFGSTGATAQLNAAVDTWNARQISTSNIVNNGKCLERQHTQTGHTFSIGDAVFWDADTLKLATVNSLLPAQAVVTGFVPDSDVVIIAYTGECETTLTHGFTQDSAYYVSRTGGQPVIEGSKPDTSQYLFRALNDSTIVVAIGNMYLEGSSGSNVATSTYKYCNTGTSCLSDSTYTQIYSTVDTVLLGTPTYNGELRCFDNQTVGSVLLKPENAGTTEIAGDAVYSLPSGQSICFYASPNGPATWNWYIVSEGNVPATGDNLGNHTATTNLAMAQFNIENTNKLTSDTVATTNITNLSKAESPTGGTAKSRIIMGTALSIPTSIRTENTANANQYGQLAVDADGITSLIQVNGSQEAGLKIEADSIVNLYTSGNNSLGFVGDTAKIITNNITAIKVGPTGKVEIKDYLLAETTSSPAQAEKFAILPVDCSGGAKTVTPPASPVAGDWFAVSDSRASAGSNNITVDTSGDKLHGAANDYIMNTNADFVRFTYVNSTIGWIKTN